MQEANGTPGEFKYKQKHIKKNRLRKKKDTDKDATVKVEEDDVFKRK